MNQAPLPKPPSGGGRRAALNSHAKALASDNPFMHQAAITHLRAMNPTDHEIRYVHSQVQKRLPSPRLVGRGMGTQENAAHLPKAHGLSILGKAVEGGVHAGINLDKTIYNAGAIPGTGARTEKERFKAQTDLVQGLTGYRQIKNIGHDPVGGGLAIASLLPIGRAGRVIEEARLAEQGARAAREEGTGLRGALAARKAAKVAKRITPITDEAARHAHLTELANQALEEADIRDAVAKFRHESTVKVLEPGHVSPETGGEAGRIIRQGLRPDFSGLGKYEKLGAKLDNPGAAEVRKQQEELRAVARQQKAARLRAAQGSAKSWEDLVKSGAARAGELPAGEFRGFEGLKAQGEARSTLPSEAHLEANPKDRFIPIQYRSAKDITVGEPGGSHAEFPSHTGTQGYAVVKDGKIERINFSHPGAGTDLKKLGRFIDQYDRNPKVQDAVKAAVEAKFSKQSLPHLEELHQFVQGLHMPPFDKGRLIDAIDKGVAGHPPTEGEQVLLEKAFGRERANAAAVIKSGGLRNALLQTASIPRAIKSAGDLSWGFRQGLLAAAYSPKKFGKVFAGMFKPAFSEAEAQARMAALAHDPLFPLMVKMGVPFTELGSAEHGVANLSDKEEAIMSNYAEHLHDLPGIRSTPGVKQAAKLVSKGVRASDRGYVVPLNEIRYALGSQMLHQALENGWNVQGKLGKDLGGLIGVLTGRGSLPKFLANHRATINALFFSPGLMSSRIHMLSPIYHARLDPFAREQSVRAARNLTGTLFALLFAARMAGAKVVTDPRNADFGKIRVGNTRIDVAGGFSQYLTFASRLASQKTISSTSGKVTKLSGNYGGTSDWDVVQNFFENKMSPVFSEGVAVAKQSRFGQPLTPQGEAANLFAPLLWSDVYQEATANGPGGGPGMAAAIFAPDLFGVGVQNYAPPKKKGRGSSGSSGNPYGGGSSGSSGNPYSGSSSSTGNPYG